MSQNNNPTFSGRQGGGFTVTGNPGFNSFGLKIVLLGSGKFLVVGATENGDNLLDVGGSYQTARDVLIERFNSDGTLDTSFAGGGRVVNSIGFSADVRDAFVQPDGSILVAGGVWKSGNSFQFAVARFFSLRMGLPCYALTQFTR